MSNDGPDFWMPKAWPLFWRRAFLLTLPVSGPIWLAVVGLCAVTMVFAIFLVLPVAGFLLVKEQLWDDHSKPAADGEKGS